jgi:hypothetical protein
MTETQDTPRRQAAEERAFLATHDEMYRRGYFDGLSEGRSLGFGGVLFVGFNALWAVLVGHRAMAILVAGVTVATMAYVSRARTRTLP